MRSLILSVVLALVAFEGAAAQVPDSILGKKVRLSVRSDRTGLRGPHSPSIMIYGALAVADDTTLVLMSPDGRTTRTPIRQIRKLQIARGTRTRVWETAMYGGLIGGATLGLAAGIAEAGCDGFCLGVPFVTAVGFVLGAVPGAFIGGVIGTGRTTDRWIDHPIVLPVPPTPQPAPQTSGPPESDPRSDPAAGRFSTGSTAH